MSGSKETYFCVEFAYLGELNPIIELSAAGIDTIRGEQL